MDARQRALEAEALEAQLLAHLEEVRAYYRAQPVIPTAEYDSAVSGALWLIDALADWRAGRIETAH
jgi:hypothetical protein